MAEKKPKFETYVEIVNREVENDDLTDLFDENGRDGWRLVAFRERHGVDVAVFERQLPDDEDDD